MSRPRLAIAQLVPVQAGLRFCRCPGCGASEVENTLTWSLERPDKVTCRRCGITVPNDTIPAKGKDKDDKEAATADEIEVLPGVGLTTPRIAPWRSILHDAASGCVSI